jgi:hypothetical protein
MTADEARKLAPGKTEPRREIVEKLVEMWNRAIQKAAQEGERSVKEHKVGALRAAVTRAERAAALDRLRTDGFSVVAEVPFANTVVAEVSW